MKVMNNCLFVDAPWEDGIGEVVIVDACLRGGMLVRRQAPGHTMRFDFDVLPDRESLLQICAGALRAASLVDAELDWLVGRPLDGAGTHHFL